MSSTVGLGVVHNLDVLCADGIVLYAHGNGRLDPFIVLALSWLCGLYCRGFGGVVVVC